MQPSSVAGHRPRVLHLTTSHLADDVRIFERECRSLAETGRFEVFLAAPGSMPPGSPVSQIPLPDIPRRRLGRFLLGPLRALLTTQAIKSDLLHIHDPELLPLAAWKALTGHPVIWDAHEDYPRQLAESGAKSWIPPFARRGVALGIQLFLKVVDRRAAAVVAATPAIASGYSNTRTVIVGNEARLETFSSCTPSVGSRSILFTGTLSSAHMFDEVVTAVASVSDCILTVAGRPPDPDLWAAATSVLGDRLRHLGWLNRAALAAAISESSVGMSTYADIPTNAENSPNKLFEFGAAGLPVVATPTASNRRFLDSSKAGVVAESFTAEGIAQAIRQLLEDELLWSQCSDAGRIWATKHGSWEVSEARLICLYRSLFEEHGS